MEELQDAIEDATYLSCTVETGVRPIVEWPVPSDDEVKLWKEAVREREGEKAFTPEWFLSYPIGFFFFAQFLKSTHKDYLRINFIESVIIYKKLRYGKRPTYFERIVDYYLKLAEDIPKKREIIDNDIERKIPNKTKEEIENFYSKYHDESNSETFVGVKAFALSEVLERTTKKLTNSDNNSNNSNTVRTSNASIILAIKAKELYADDIFDDIEVVVFESVKRQYWKQYLLSHEYKRTVNLLWYQDRKVVYADFYTIRVLGRGGFGLVTACKKGTSGRLYALKAMSKKRLKLRKGEELALSERNALKSTAFSPFVVSLVYAFQSKEDLYLILELMTGGDLGFHLSRKRCFSKEECIYYAARIMLGLQHIHDQKLVYRDLKPENCLLGEDGRVKITDLGLAVPYSSNLKGAAGTRGYWAPEMLRRDKNGKRIPYGYAVDWFSFGCCLVEFISGVHPFRNEAAIKFGNERGHTSKDKAIDCATLEMDLTLHPSKFDDNAADLCRQLLNKDENNRIGSHGSDQIMLHEYFQDVDWDLMISNKTCPPSLPPKDVNASSQSDIGNFKEDKDFLECVISEKDNEIYSDWDWISPIGFNDEVITFLISEREHGKSLLPDDSSCCCTVL